MNTATLCCAQATNWHQGMYWDRCYDEFAILGCGREYTQPVGVRTQLQPEPTRSNDNCARTTRPRISIRLVLLYERGGPVVHGHIRFLRQLTGRNLLNSSGYVSFGYVSVSNDTESESAHSQLSFAPMQTSKDALKPRRCLNDRQLPHPICSGALGADPLKARPLVLI